MPEHPCAEGLSSACFKAYPAWARQAVAYKLLHAILPKQLTKNLPKGLGLALIGPGAIIPSGVVLPPGMAIPPDFTFPDRWVPWLYFNFLTGELPWTLFPEGWKPGDPLPPGVTYAPGFVLPPGWTPEDHPPGWLIPGYTPVPTPPDSGAAPPGYVQVFEPGPISTASKTSIKIAEPNTRNPTSDEDVQWARLSGDYNYKMVNSYPDVKDSTYNYIESDLYYDKFGTSVFAISPTSSITSIQVMIRGSAESGKTRDIGAYIKVGANEYYSSDQTWEGSSWAEKTFTWETDPETGDAWTPARANDIGAFGYRSGAYTGFSAYVSRVYLKANYT